MLPHQVLYVPTMMMTSTILSLALLGAGLAQSITSTQQVQANPVTVSLSPSASVVGISSLTTGGVDSFSGIRYAQPPVGELRLKPPLPLTSPDGLIDATKLPPTCSQLYGLPPVFPDAFTQMVAGALKEPVPWILPESEDCLALNVMRPAGILASSKLPVLFWIHGGGFQVYMCS